MTDLISRQDAIDAILKAVINHDSASGRIANLPSAQQKGEWEICKDADGEYGVCSECGQDADFSHYGVAYNFCPNCGADMRGE